MLLLRSGAKGNFVLYPSHWRPRFRDPQNRRFQTKCDMIVGGCACGRFHDENDYECEMDEYGDEVESFDSWRFRTRSTRMELA